MSRMVIENTICSNNKFVCEFDASGNVANYIDDHEFIAEYDFSIEQVPREILLIPFISNIAPVIWATDSELEVPTLDPIFAQGLRTVRDTLHKFYPKVGFDEGQIICNDDLRLEESSYDSEYDNSAVLFSMGVDSIASFIRHIDENPPTITIQGIDEKLQDKEGWDNVKKGINKFAESQEVESYFIKSNFREFINQNRLNGRFRKHLSSKWWSSVQHGMGTLCVCAPLTYTKNIGSLYIASSFPKHYEKPWGSHPQIDNNIEWTGTKCFHDAYELDRQEKWQIISQFLKYENPEIDVIRSCSNTDYGGVCNNCIQCYRNIVGMVIAEIDPNRFGYTVNNEVYSSIRKSLERGGGKYYYWYDLQQHLPNNITDLDLNSEKEEQFFSWFSNFNIDKLERGETNRQKLESLVYNILITYTNETLTRNIADMYNKFKYNKIR